MARNNSGDGVTRLESFMRALNLKPGKVAKEAGISRQHLLRIRKGQMDTTVMMAMRIRDACGRLAGRPIGIAEVFDVE